MKWYSNKKVTLKSTQEQIENIFSLEKLGAGHEGIVFKYQNIALKYLKNDKETRKSLGLMTEEKAFFFQDLDLKIFLNPIDILLDQENDFIGYATPLIRSFRDESKENGGLERNHAEYTCKDLLRASMNLEDDIQVLNKNKILIKDINKGSFLYSEDYLHICDMDKFFITKSPTLENQNRIKMNFIISKVLYYEMIKNNKLTKEELSLLLKIVSRQSNSIKFLKELQKEISKIEDVPLDLYSRKKAEVLLKRRKI